MERKPLLEQVFFTTPEDQRTGLEKIFITINEYHTRSSELLNFEKEEVLRKVQEEARILQSQRITHELGSFLETSRPSQVIDVDLPGFLEEARVSSSIPNAAFINQEEFEEAKDRGISSASDYILSLFTPKVTFSFSKIDIPYIPWRRDLADLYLVKEIEEVADGAIYSLPTKISGVTIDFFFEKDENFPQRSLFLRRE